METRYDGLGRVTKVIPPDGSVGANYTEYRYGWSSAYWMGGGLGYVAVAQTGVFDATGRGRVEVRDLLGGLVEVRENPNRADLTSSVITTWRVAMDPDVLNRGETRNGRPVLYVKWLDRVITQGSQTRTLRSDHLGRLVSETHPENGATTYLWDDGGRRLQKTDARGVTATTTWDVLDRPLAVDYSDATPDVTYAYDLGAYGIGRLYSVSNAHATSVYSYDAMGRVVREEQTIGGLNFSLQTAFNLAGQATATILPNGTVITRHYNAVGQLEAITSDWVDAQHPAVLAGSFTYDASGALESVEYGNGTRSTRSYNSGGQLKRLRHGTLANPGSLMDYEYNYQETVANNGLIHGIIDWRDRSRDVSYTYDDFWRLAMAQTAGSHWGLAWTYDRYGNRTAQAVTKGTAPAQTLAVSAATNRVTGWTYDAAGNTTSDGLHTYAYDAENRIRELDGGTAVYSYDGQGRRVMKVTATETVRYLLGVGEHSSVVGWKKLYVYLGREKLVEYSGGTTWFFHADHLGSPKVKTALDGSEAERWEYYPYGETWLPGAPGDQHRYTGHVRDAESGNDFAGARDYSSSRGRWLAVDPVLGDLANPQRLNRYAYAVNDPVNFLDPDGRGEELFDPGFRIVVSSGVLYATMYVQAFSHSLFGVPQRPAKAALEKEVARPPRDWSLSGFVFDEVFESQQARKKLVSRALLSIAVAISSKPGALGVYTECMTGLFSGKKTIQIRWGSSLDTAGYNDGASVFLTAWAFNYNFPIQSGPAVGYYAQFPDNLANVITHELLHLCGAPSDEESMDAWTYAEALVGSIPLTKFPVDKEGSKP